MQVKNLFKAGIATLLAVTITACGSNNTDSDVDTEVVETNTVSENTPAVATATGLGSQLSAELRSQQLAEAERDQALSMTVFYFEFNRSELDAASRDALVYHAARLKDNPGMRVRLEGHADERGTREYNIALGERRAQAIERYLLVQGVSSIQMETISYGEESPIDNGSTESSYARNRRVELR